MRDLSSQKRIELQRMTADAVSLMLNGVLSRRYLEAQWPNENYTSSMPGTASPGELAASIKFLRLTQVGLPIEDKNMPMEAMRSILSFCHGIPDLRLFFVVNYDGTNYGVYIGVQVQGDAPRTHYLIGNLSQFIQSTWPGTLVEKCGTYRLNDESNTLWNDIGRPIDESTHCLTLTGIPSLRDDNSSGQSQSLDLFMQGMQGQPYTYMVVADSVACGELDNIIAQCRALIGQVHSFKEITLNETLTLARTWGSSVDASESWTDGTSTEDSSMKGWSVGLGVFLGLFGAVFPPILPFTGTGLIQALISGISRGSYTKVGSSIQKSHTMGVSQSESVGGSESASRAMGEKILNAHAEALEELIRRHINRYQKARATGGWNVGIYLCANNPYHGNYGAAQLRALFGGQDTDIEPIRIHNLETVSYQAQQALVQMEYPDLQIVDSTSQVPLNHPLGPLFDGFTTLITTDELALPIRFPQTDLPGVSTISIASFPLNTRGAQIPLGQLANSHDSSLSYGVNHGQLNKHCLVAGISGSGKTNTILHIINQLMKGASPVPFLVIEPAKEEYVEWAMKFNENLPPGDPNRITIFMPGVKTWHGVPLSDRLHLNPFEVIWPDPAVEPQVLAHVDRVKSVLVAAMPMQEVLPTLLEDLIYAVYSMPATNWLRCEEPAYGTRFPTLTQLLSQIDPVIRQKGYEERIRANLTAALTTRIESLRRGWKRDLFDVPVSTPWNHLFSKNVVINLSQLGDDADKCLAMSLILQFLYEFRQSEASISRISAEVKAAGASGSRLKHVTIIEEAHRVMMKATDGLAGQAHPQAKAADMFASILSEIRVYGEGLIIADQVPGRLVADAIKNTNLKIVHRLVASDDREAMAGCMNMTGEQKAMLSRLRPGQAIVFGDNEDAPSWVKIPLVKE